MLPGSLTPLDADLVGRFDPARVATHAAALSALLPDDTAGYLREALREYNVALTQHRYHRQVATPGDVYFSLAGRDAPVEAVALSYSGATPREGLVAPLHIGASGPSPRGAVVLLTSRPTPTDIINAVASGVGALVYIAGNTAAAAGPLPDTAGLASIPVIAIGQAAGEGYLALAESGPVSVRLRVAIETRTEPLTILVAAISGVESASQYVVAGATIARGDAGRDTLGAATLLECCRALASERGRLRRGVRCVWWPDTERVGEASRRYVQQTWGDLMAHASAYVELGGAPSTNAAVTGHPQLRWLTETTLRDVGVERVLWSVPPREPAGASFAAAGIPSLSANVGSSAAAGQLLLLGRLCSYPLLPFDLVAVARLLEAHVLGHASLTADEVDLSPLRTMASAWRVEAERLQLVALHTAQGEATNLEEGLALLNVVADRVNRLLIPCQYRSGDRYVVTALSVDLLPGLGPVDRSRAAVPASSDVNDDQESRLHERNRLSDALREASRLTNEVLETLSQLGMT